MGNATSYEARADALYKRKEAIDTRQANVNKNKSTLSANTETLKANVGQKVASLKDQETPMEREIQKATQLLHDMQRLY
jgi:formate dehydrogenase assembly factor FdhD